MQGYGGIFETIATLGTASQAKAPEQFPVDMQPKPIEGPVVPPAVAPPTQMEVTKLAQGLSWLLRTNRGVKPEAADQLAMAITAVCGPESTLAPGQQAQAVNQILSSSPAVDKAAVPVLYGLISMFIASQPVAQRRDAQRARGRKVVGESIFGNYLFANDALPQKVEQPWSTELQAGVSADKAEPVTPRGMSGFGADVPVDHPIPTGMKWLGHGMFGGRTRHGGYGVSRYGEPVTGYGLGAEWAPGQASPDQATLLAHGYYKGDESGMNDQVAKMCPLFPYQWDCNMPNLKLVSIYGGMVNMGIDYYVAAVRSGKVPPPPGFPSLAAGASAPAPAPAAPRTVTAPAESNVGLLVGLGVAALAIGGAMVVAKKKRAA
jgi:hypothetical protein